MENNLDIILNSKIKIKIIRLFISRNENFRVSGREIARFIKASPPTTHFVLKELNSRNILNLEIIGRQHIYSLNSKNRTVKDILIPTFRKELSLKEDIGKFILSKIKVSKLKQKIVSLVLYGSLQRGQAGCDSDADLVVIIKDKSDEKEVTEKFIEDIAPEFNEYFGIHLDAYVKSKEDFIHRLKKHLPPVSSLAESYTVIFGKDPLELI